MTWRYSIFGLTVKADRPIPGFAPAGADGAADVDIRTEGASTVAREAEWREHYVTPYLGEHGRPVLRVWSSVDDRLYRFLYDDGAQFIMDAAGRDIWSDWPEALTIDDIGPYFTGPILGFVLRLRGVLSLHASAVVVAGRALAFVGPPGAGKSTTAAAFALRGNPVISDDIVAMKEDADGYRVHSGYPWIRLWPQSVEALFGSQDALPRISPDDPNWDKRYLDLDADGFEFASGEPPLGAIYILEGRSASDEAPRITDSAGPVRLLSLAGNTYMNYLPGNELRAREFEALGRLARRVAVRSVLAHIEAARLPRLCDVILEDYARLSTGASAGSSA